MSLSPYLDAVRAWNPSLDITSYRVDPYGLNNLVIIVNDAWVFRFPRNPESAEGLRREAAVLDLARRRVRAPLPDFRIDEATGFVAYRLLPGRPLYRHLLLRLDVYAQDRFAAELGEFLRDLHASPASEATAAGLGDPPPAPPADLWPERLAAIRETLYPYLWADQHAYVEDLFAPVLDDRLDMAAYRPAIIHNDLASYHILVDPDDGRLTGVLDFGEAGWGDPAADLGILINTYGESFVRRMAPVYPELPDLLERARFRAAYIELEWALKGAQTANLEWTLVHLGRARDSLPFGAERDAA